MPAIMKEVRVGAICCRIVVTSYQVSPPSGRTIIDKAPSEQADKSYEDKYREQNEPSQLGSTIMTANSRAVTVFRK